jgi:predicted ribosomally synthesized peptide with SipW-like signal peptide
MNKKIALSSLSIMAALALIGGATFAFFSDTETSTGNTFTAGAIDLQIDNTSYALDHNIPGFATPSGALVASTNTSWTLADLTIQKFFNFVDLKPGDYGEDTISVHVNDNDAWICAAAQVTDDTDESCTEPELGDDSTCVAPDTNGELDEQVNFAFWPDDGDNVLEVGETPFLAGPISGLNGAGQIALADSTGGALGPGPVAGGTTVYVGKAWCFGDLTAAPLDQDGVGTDGPIAPDRIGTGFTCDGSALDNSAQTDAVVGDLEFYAVQSRNNPDFDCDVDYTPSWVESI